MSGGDGGLDDMVVSEADNSDDDAEVGRLSADAEGPAAQVKQQAKEEDDLDNELFGALEESLMGRKAQGGDEADDQIGKREDCDGGSDESSDDDEEDDEGDVDDSGHGLGNLSAMFDRAADGGGEQGDAGASASDEACCLCLMGPNDADPGDPSGRKVEFCQGNARLKQRLCLNCQKCGVSCGPGASTSSSRSTTSSRIPASSFWSPSPFARP